MANVGNLAYELRLEIRKKIKQIEGLGVNVFPYSKSKYENRYNVGEPFSHIEPWEGSVRLGIGLPSAVIYFDENDRYFNVNPEEDDSDRVERILGQLTRMSQRLDEHIEEFKRQWRIALH